MKDIHENKTLESPAPGLRFLTTQWQLIRSAGSETDRAVAHLDRLLRRYLPALEKFLRTRYSLDQSSIEDMLQSFIATRILHGRLLNLADPQRGRFRTVLLSALVNHVRIERRKSQANKRIDQTALVSWDTVDETELENPAQSDESSLFQSPLNQQIIDEATKRFREHCDRRGKLLMWEVFEARLLKPIMEETPPEPYDRLQSRLHLTSPTQATNLLMTAKRSIARILKEVIEEFALNVNDAEIEFQQLKRYCGLDSSKSK